MAKQITLSQSWGRGKKAARKPVKRVKRFRTKGALHRQIKQVLSSLAETKQAFLTTGDSLIKFNSACDTIADMQRIIPSISQGVADNQRIGDQIRAKGITIKGFVRLDTASTIGTVGMPQVMVRMMIVSLKSRPNYDEATASASQLSSLLKRGGTTTAFTGVLRDIYSPINTDLWTVHSDKKFVLKQDFINGATGPMDVSKCLKFFNIKLRCKNRLLKYDTGASSSLYPVNYGPMLLLGYSFLDGTTPDTVNTRVGLQYDVIFNYEDA